MKTSLSTPVIPLRTTRRCIKFFQIKLFSLSWSEFPHLYKKMFKAFRLDKFLSFLSFLSAGIFN